MELRPARMNDVPALKELWRVCFGDETPYIDLFFSGLFRPEDMAVLEEEGAVRSMAALLDAPLRVDGETVPARYLYAMCTHPEHRGKGYARQLLDYAAGYCQELGAMAVTLVPSEPSLFHFYGRAGYETAFWNRVITTPVSGLPLANGVVLPVTAAMYNKIRRAALGRLPFVDYSDGFIAHQLNVCAMAQGGLLRLDLPQGVGCAAVEKGEDGLRKLKELVVPPCAEGAALALLLTGPRARAMEARIPARPGEPDARPFGMVKWLTMRRWKLENAFLGLALD